MLEFLNHRKEYTSQKNAWIYNLVFIAYPIFIFNRFFLRSIPVLAREVINRGEHALLALVLCLAILQFLKMNFVKKMSLNAKLVITSFTFQIIGLLNEVYQWMYAPGHKEIFSADTIHDLISNVSGNIVFVILILLLERKRNFVIVM